MKKVEAGLQAVGLEKDVDLGEIGRLTGVRLVEEGAGVYYG